MFLHIKKKKTIRLHLFSCSEMPLIFHTSLQKASVTRFVVMKKKKIITEILLYFKNLLLNQGFIGRKETRGPETHSTSLVLYCCGPQPFWDQGPFFWKTIIPWTRDRGDDLEMIQSRYIYCALYFYHCYIVMYGKIQIIIMHESYHQALDSQKEHATYIPPVDSS